MVLGNMVLGNFEAYFTPLCDWKAHGMNSRGDPSRLVRILQFDWTIFHNRNLTDCMLNCGLLGFGFWLNLSWYHLQKDTEEKSE